MKLITRDCLKSARKPRPAQSALVGTMASIDKIVREIIGASENIRLQSLMDACTGAVMAAESNSVKSMLARLAGGLTAASATPIYAALQQSAFGNSEKASIIDAIREKTQQPVLVEKLAAHDKQRMAGKCSAANYLTNADWDAILCDAKPWDDETTAMMVVQRFAKGGLTKPNTSFVADMVVVLAHKKWPTGQDASYKLHAFFTKVSAIFNGQSQSDMLPLLREYPDHPRKLPDQHREAMYGSEEPVDVNIEFFDYLKGQVAIRSTNKLLRSGVPTAQLGQPRVPGMASSLNDVRLGNLAMFANKMVLGPMQAAHTGALLSMAQKQSTDNYPFQGKYGRVKVCPPEAESLSDVDDAAPTQLPMRPLPAPPAITRKGSFDSNYGRASASTSGRSTSLSPMSTRSRAPAQSPSPARETDLRDFEPKVANKGSVLGDGLPPASLSEVEEQHKDILSKAAAKDCDKVGANNDADEKKQNDADEKKNAAQKGKNIVMKKPAKRTRSDELTAAPAKLPKGAPLQPDSGGAMWLGARALASASKNGVRVWLDFADVKHEKLVPYHAYASEDEAWAAAMQYVHDHNKC